MLQLRHRLHHLRRRVIVQRHARERHADENPFEQTVDDRPQPFGGRLADVTVPCNACQRRKRRHQPADVRRQRRPILHACKDVIDRVDEVGQDHTIEQRRELGDVAGGIRRVARGCRRRVGDRAAPDARLHQRHFHFRFPAQLPQLMKRAGPAGYLLRRRPVEIQQPEPVKQHAPFTIDVLPQIEVQGADLLAELQSQTARRVAKIALERHDGRGLGDFPDHAADLEPRPDHLERRVLSAAVHAQRRFPQLGQSRARQIAHAGERVSQPRGFDDAGGGRLEIFGTQQPRRLDEPPDRCPFRRQPQVVVPAGRIHAGAVAAAITQSRVGPGNPRDLDFGSWQSLQQLRIGPGRSAVGQRRRVPCAADDGNAPVPLFDGSANRLPHEGFTRKIVIGDRGLRPKRLHRFRDGLEDPRGVLTPLDLVFPPQLVIVVSGCRCERGQRIDASRLGNRRLPGALRFTVLISGRRRLRLLPCELDRQREIHEADRHTALLREPDRLPFGRERGKRIEDGAPRRLRPIHQQRNRRAHRRIRRKRQHRVGVGRTFNQHEIRRPRLERA